ncbi:MAG: hypothetical protein ABIB11_02160 [Candidatus Omnitrophota bacterium]
MARRILVFVFLFCYTMQISACSGTIRRKFVRKKTLEENKNEVVFQPEDYSKEFTNKQLYANYFAFWKSSESELIDSIKDKSSQKRQELYLSYAQKEMNKLYSLLDEGKQQEMLFFVDELTQISEKMIDVKYFSSHRIGILKQIQKHYKLFKRNFSYNKVKDRIEEDKQ